MATIHCNIIGEIKFAQNKTSLSWSDSHDEIIRKFRNINKNIDMDDAIKIKALLEDRLERFGSDLL